MSMLIDAYRFAAAPASYPNYLGNQTSSRPTTTTSHAVQMPATVNSGDLLIANFQMRGESVATIPSGWTLIYDFPYNTTRQVSAYKVAAGTEGGGTATFTTGTAVRSTSIVHRIEAGTYSSTPQAQRVGQTPGGSPNPPSLSPSWGALSTLWIAGFGGEDNGSVSVYPYADGQTHIRCDPTLTGAVYNEIATCWTKQNVSSLDPSAFTRSVTAACTAFLIAVRPL